MNRVLLVVNATQLRPGDRLRWPTLPSTLAHGLAGFYVSRLVPSSDGAVIIEVKDDKSSLVFTIARSDIDCPWEIERRREYTPEEVAWEIVQWL